MGVMGIPGESLKVDSCIHRRGLGKLPWGHRHCGMVFGGYRGFWAMQGSRGSTPGSSIARDVRQGVGGSALRLALLPGHGEEISDLFPSLMHKELG